MSDLEPKVEDDVMAAEDEGNEEVCFVRTFLWAES
jgi:hypothetical protein